MSNFWFTGVGKTSFVHTVCHDEPLSSPPPVTVGCHIEIKVHLLSLRLVERIIVSVRFLSRSCTNDAIERSVRISSTLNFTMWAEAFNTRIVDRRCFTMSLMVKQERLTRRSPNRNSNFFPGIILVSDLTSRQSYDNLKEWLYEVIRYRSRQKLYVETIEFRLKIFVLYLFLSFRPAEFTPDVLRSFDIPILLVHTKFDESNGISLLNTSRSTGGNAQSSSLSDSLLPNVNRKSALANLFNCDEIFVVRTWNFVFSIGANLFSLRFFQNCYSNKRFSVDAPNVAKLNSFFEKVRWNSTGLVRSTTVLTLLAA